MKATKVTKNAKELSDAQIEAIVAEAMAAEAAVAASEAQPPSSAIVWWRAQMRARQEAATVAEKPITIVHAVSIAAGIGLMLSVIGYVIGGVKGSMAWVSAMWQSAVQAVAAVPAADLTSRWVSVGLTTALVTIVIASIAAYVIYADE
jgi:hypothetical protein